MNQTKEQIEKMILDIKSRIFNNKNKDFKIKTIDDALYIFKNLKEYEKKSNKEEYSNNGKIISEWKITLDDLKNWFNEKEDITKTKTYLKHQSLIINSLFINKEYFNELWKHKS